LIDSPESLDFGIELCSHQDSRIDLSPPLRGRLPFAHYSSKLIEKLASLEVNWGNFYLDSFCYGGDLRLLNRLVDLGARFEIGEHHFANALMTSEFYTPSFMRKYLRGVIDLGCPLTPEDLKLGLTSQPQAVGILFSVLTDNEILSIDWMAILPQGEIHLILSSYVAPLLKELREKSTELVLRNIRFSISPPADYYKHINKIFKSYENRSSLAEALLMELVKYRVPLEAELLRQIMADGLHVTLLKGLKRFSQSEKASVLKLSDEVLREYLNHCSEIDVEVLEILIYFAACDRNVSSDVLQLLAALRRTDPQVIKLRSLL